MAGQCPEAWGSWLEPRVSPGGEPCGLSEQAGAREVIVTKPGGREARTSHRMLCLLYPTYQAFASSPVPGALAIAGPTIPQSQARRVRPQVGTPLRQPDGLEYPLAFPFLSEISQVWYYGHLPPGSG